MLQRMNSMFVVLIQIAIIWVLRMSITDQDVELSSVLTYIVPP